MIEDRAAIEPHVLPGERLLWAGRPDPTKHFTANDVVLIPFSLVWLGFVIFWLTAAISSGAPTFFVLFGSVFLVIGLLMSVGRFFIKAARKKRTRYGITSSRVIVVEGNRVTDAPVRGQSASIEVKPNGYGSIEIGRPAGMRGRFSGPMFYANSGLEMFTPGIPGVGLSDVADGAALRAAFAEARGASPAQ
jgi:hypothetical protein